MTKLLTALALLFSVEAFATRGQMYCSTSAPVADAGYFATFSEDMSQADVNERTFARPVFRTHMTCQSVVDGRQTTTYCRSMETENEGYFLKVYSPGYPEPISAKFSRLRIEGQTEILTDIRFGEMNCSYWN